MHTLDEISALLHVHKTAFEAGLPVLSNAALNRLRQISDEMGPGGFGTTAPAPYEPVAEAPTETTDATEPAAEPEPAPTLVDRRL